MIRRQRYAVRTNGTSTKQIMNYERSLNLYEPE